MRGDRVITLIGAFKLAKALLLIAVGIGALAAVHGDVSHWVAAVRVDPNNRYIERVLAFAQDPKKLHELGIGTFIYAAVFALEGIGLLAHKRWAEYVTIIITTSFIPLEVYELVEHRSAAKLVILIANLAIVVYLVVRVSRRHRGTRGLTGSFPRST